MADRTQIRRRRMWRLAGVLAAAFGVAAVGVALAAGPAAANDTSPGTVASTTAVQTDGLVNAPDGGDGGQCTKDVCRRINWCDNQPGGKVADDAPVVAVSKGSQEPQCIKRPNIKKVVCCENGTGTVTVWIENPNCIKLRVRVAVDNGAPLIQWIDANNTGKFTFGNVDNGDHVVSASVWVKQGGVWCNFAKAKFQVKCTGASPSASHSPSPRPSVSASASHSASPSQSTPAATTGNLPVTGPPVGALAAGGALAVGLGGGAAWYGSRRRRPKFTIE